MLSPAQPSSSTLGPVKARRGPGAPARRGAHGLELDIPNGHLPIQGEGEGGGLEALPL